MSEATVVDARLDKLGRIMGGALLLALAAVPLIGAVMAEQVQDVIRARSFAVISYDDTVRAVMNFGGILYMQC
mgnify:CR=1 FL=1